MVLAADDDQVAAPPDDEQHAGLEEAEVAGAEKPPPGVVGQRRLERLAGLVRSIPIRVGNTRPGHPDLSDAEIREEPLRGRIDGDDDVILAGAPTSDERPRRRRAGRDLFNHLIA